MILLFYVQCLRTPSTFLFNSIIFPNNILSSFWRPIRKSALTLHMEVTGSFTFKAKFSQTLSPCLAIGPVKRAQGVLRGACLQAENAHPLHPKPFLLVYERQLLTTIIFLMIWDNPFFSPEHVQELSHLKFSPPPPPQDSLLSSSTDAISWLRS